MHGLEGKNQAVVAVARYFEYEHLPVHLQDISKQVYLLAETMINSLPDNPQLTLGLNNLLIAKDCFVRAALDKK